MRQKYIAKKKKKRLGELNSVSREIKRKMTPIEKLFVTFESFSLIIVKSAVALWTKLSS